MLETLGVHYTNKTMGPIYLHPFFNTNNLEPKSTFVDFHGKLLEDYFLDTQKNELIFVPFDEFGVHDTDFDGDHFDNWSNEFTKDNDIFINIEHNFKLEKSFTYAFVPLILLIFITFIGEKNDG